MLVVVSPNMSLIHKVDMLVSITGVPNSEV